VKKGNKATPAGTKRKAEHVLDESTSRLNKKRKILTPKSLKTGVRKAVYKARTAVSVKKRRSTQQIKKKISNVKSKVERKTEKTKKPKLQSKVQVQSKVKVQSKIKAKPRARANPKIKTKPAIKAKSRVKVKTQKRITKSAKPRIKATVSSGRSRVSLEIPTSPATQSPSEQGSSRLKRPSEKVKAQINASAKRSTGLKRLKRTVAGGKATRSKSQEVEAAQAPVRQSSVKRPANQTVQTVKGGKSGQRRTIRAV
jgi:[histone H3]-lysine4 N-trimethyltransferase ASH1L